MDPDEKRKAISEALRVTKPGGTVFFAFIMNDAVLTGWGLQGDNLAVGLRDGVVTPEFHCASIPELYFEMSTVAEIEALMAGMPVEKRALVAADGLSEHFRDTLDAASEEQYAAWLRYHFATCERPDLIGHSSHIFYIGRKTA